MPDDMGYVHIRASQNQHAIRSDKAKKICIVSKPSGGMLNYLTL